MIFYSNTHFFMPEQILSYHSFITSMEDLILIKIAGGVAQVVECLTD
jgi:hypothetical protein